jgi:hypothetical protein
VKLIVVTISLFVSSVVIAQDTVGLRKVTADLNAALVAKDTVTIKAMLGDNIVYGHSNSWLQTKQEVVNDLVSGKNGYKNIELVEKESFIVQGEAVAVRSVIHVEGFVNATNFDMKLQVLQVWKRINKQWKLIARQSVKIG